MTNCMLFLVSASICFSGVVVSRTEGHMVCKILQLNRPKPDLHACGRYYFEGQDRLIRFVCGASCPGWPFVPSFACSCVTINESKAGQEGDAWQLLYLPN